MNTEHELKRFLEGAADPESPRDEHRRELRDRVLAAMPSAPGPTLVSPQSRWRSIMKSPSFRWSATAALVLFVALLVPLYTLLSPPAAWADVSAALKQAKTLSMKIVVYQGKDIRTRETLSFKEPDRVRIDREEGSTVIDWKRRKMLSLMPKQKMAVEVSMSEHHGQPGPRNWLARLKEIIGSKKAKRIGSKTLENHACTGWQVTNKLGNTTAWADAKTGRLVRVETTMKSGDVKTVMSDFRFDPPLDESLFSLEIPEGYERVAKSTVSPRKDAIDAILLMLRIRAGGNNGVFPDSLSNSKDFLIAAGKYDWSQETENEATLRNMITQAFFWLNSNQRWVYQGKEVKVGDATTPVFWRPVGDGKFQVIYGDFKVRKMDETQLQK
jgi:outer membrane lipoprotein-sorting protein